MVIDGLSMNCGSRPTVLDPNFYDVGAAYRGFLVINPRHLSRLPTAVKRWAYSHECAHHTVGQDEIKADCVAVQRGRREGWLVRAGLEQVCDFIRPAKQDRSHLDGDRRCELMRQCFQRTNVGQIRRSN